VIPSLRDPLPSPPCGGGEMLRPARALCHPWVPWRAREALAGEWDGVSGMGGR